MGEEGWILAYLTQRPGHYDAFTVPEALQQAAKDGRLCLREGRLVAAEADGAATAAVDAKRADVQSQRHSAQVVARLRQARCGRGDEEEGVDPAEEPVTHAASQSSGVALAEHAGVSAMEQDSPVSVCSSHVPNALATRAHWAHASAGQHGVVV